MYLLTAGIIAVAAQATGAAPVVFTCSNPGGDASWELTVDFTTNTADGFPARISDQWISWHDTAKGGYYDLDRQSGALTVRFASSTGGYFLHDTCQPKR